MNMSSRISGEDFTVEVEAKQGTGVVEMTVIENDSIPSSRRQVDFAMTTEEANLMMNQMAHACAVADRPTYVFTETSRTPVEMEEPPKADDPEPAS